MKLEGTQAKSFTDVVAYSVDPVFDKREIVIETLAEDLIPGDVIKADGTKFGAADTEAPLVVIHPAKAGAKAHVIIADRGVVLKRDALNGADAAGTAAAIAAIEKSGINRLTIN
ncbi:hypothetical protein [Serratia bockelmannii]|uniref:hypothetical protein n=1 Tax=Serratia bockelmannii TaxID=2703793 RepID=UPI00313EA3C9